MGEDSSVSESSAANILVIGRRVADVIGDQSERSFAQKAGIGQSALNSIVRGKTKPSLESLVAIARSGGVTVDWLATGEGPRRRGDNRPPGMAEDQAAYGPDAAYCLHYVAASAILAERDLPVQLPAAVLADAIVEFFVKAMERGGREGFAPGRLQDRLEQLARETGRPRKP